MGIIDCMSTIREAIEYILSNCIYVHKKDKKRNEWIEIISRFLRNFPWNHLENFEFLLESYLEYILLYAIIHLVELLLPDWKFKQNLFKCIRALIIILKILI